MIFLIADDHAVVRKGVRQILSEEFQHADFQEAASVNEALHLIKQHSFDLVMLDISMPGRSGLDLLHQLKAEGNKTPVLVMTMHPEAQYAVRVLKAGASGFMGKDSVPDDLTKAVHRILAGRKFISENVAEQLLDNNSDIDTPLFNLLSDRELEVLKLMASGKSVSDIADVLALSVATVSTYRSRIIEKMKMKNNAELIHYAISEGLV